MARFPGLDLLRALAISLVVLRHMPESAIPPFLMPLHAFGWMGVDLFFVLSGFLIGSQWLAPYKSGGTPALGAFYLRRGFRVLPAFLVVLALYCLIPGFSEQPKMAPAWRFVTFTMNFGFDYGKGGGFSHVWSLCVEEHFYLLFPLAAAWAMRRPSLSRTAGAALFLLIGGIALRFWLWETRLSASPFSYSEVLYYPTYTRLDGLLAGVLLAVARTFRPEWWARAGRRGDLFALGGLILAAVAVTLFAEPRGLPGAVIGYPALAGAFALLCAAAVSAQGVLARVRIPGAAWVAGLSYSFYLIHKAAMHLDQQMLDDGLLHGSRGLLIFGATGLAGAWLLHVLVERPSLRLRDRYMNSFSFSSPLYRPATNSP